MGSPELGRKGPGGNLRGSIRGDARSGYKWQPGEPAESAYSSLEKSLECDPG